MVLQGDKMFSENDDMTMKKSEIEEKMFKAPEYNKEEEADEQIKELIKSTVERGERRRICFTPENRERIIELVRAGNGATTAAKAVGVIPSTLYKWVSVGMEDIANEKESDYADFAIELRRADAAFETSIYEVLVNASQESGKEYMIQWILERKYPERFSLKKKQDMNLNVKQGTGVQVEFKIRDSNDRPVEEQQVIEEGFKELAKIHGVDLDTIGEFFERKPIDNIEKK